MEAVDKPTKWPRLTTGEWRSSLLAGPVGLILLIFFVAPLATLIAYSFLTAGLFAVEGPPTLENYSDAVNDPTAQLLGKNAAITGLLAAVVCIAVALPVAYWLRYNAGRWRLIVLFLIIGSLLASYLVRIYAWRTILGDSGLLNSALESLGIIDEPLGFLLFNRATVTIALVHIYLPYVLLMLSAGFAPLTPAYLEAAQDLGAGTWKRWTRVILPSIAAPLASAFLLVFVLSAGDYVTPQYLGGENGRMLGVLIQSQFVDLGNWGLGAALSLLMLVAFATCYLVMSAILRLLKLNRLQFPA